MSRPYVYMSHPITFAPNDSEGTMEEYTPEIGRIADLLEGKGIVSFRPLLHNPWNNTGFSPPMDRDLIVAESKGLCRYLRVNRVESRLPLLPNDARGAFMADFYHDGIGAKEVVDTDISLISQSCAMFAFLNPPSVGGSMEIVYAGLMGKPIFGVVLEDYGKISKWAIEHCTHIFHSYAVDASLIGSLCDTYNLRG